MAGPFDHIGWLNCVRDARDGSRHRGFETFRLFPLQVFGFEMNNLEDVFMTQDPVFIEGIRMQELVQ